LTQSPSLHHPVRPTLAGSPEASCYLRTQREHVSNTPPPETIPERAAAAAAVLNRYRIEYTNDWDIPNSISYAQSQIQEALERDQPIQLVLPAFPFKSSNRSKKVLGRFPDEAERLSLLHLNGLCLGIKDVADADAYLTVVSDGIVYNGTLCLNGFYNHIIQ
jgi:hypothetical protein